MPACPSRGPRLDSWMEVSLVATPEFDCEKCGKIFVDHALALKWTSSLYSLHSNTNASLKPPGFEPRALVALCGQDTRVCIQIRSYLRIQIYSIFGIRCFFKSWIYSVFGIRSKFTNPTHSARHWHLNDLSPLT